MSTASAGSSLATVLVAPLLERHWADVVRIWAEGIATGDATFETAPPADWARFDAAKVPGLRLALVGSGPAEAELRASFAGTATTFTGYMSGAELASAYASADVFLFPSDTETLGFVAMESMASGVPAIGARAGGIPDVIEHGVNGLMFTPGDLDDLTEQVTRLVTDTGLRQRLGASARLDMERHGWRAATEALIDHYRTAIRLYRRYDPPSRY